MGQDRGRPALEGKNYVGAYHQPAVLCDPATLDTLPEEEALAGYAEVEERPDRRREPVGACARAVPWTPRSSRAACGRSSPWWPRTSGTPGAARS